MQLGNTRKPGRFRNRLIVAVLVAAVGGAAWRVATRRPQLPQPAAEPPRLGYATNGLSERSERISTAAPGGHAGAER